MASAHGEDASGLKSLRSYSLFNSQTNPNSWDDQEEEARVQFSLIYIILSLRTTTFIVSWHMNEIRL